MTTHITIELNDEEIGKFDEVNDILVEMYNELSMDEKENANDLKEINLISEKLTNLVCKFCNEHYKKLHY